MTAVAELCGHRWTGHGVLRAIETGSTRHRCIEPADHPPHPIGHRCHCGKTTWMAR